MTTESTADLSTPEPIVKWSEEWWANAKPEVAAHRCTAHRKNGDRCKRVAINGGRVCPHHGGASPAVKAKARLRLEMASDRLARELLNMTTDPNVADPVKLGGHPQKLSDRRGRTKKPRLLRGFSTGAYRGSIPQAMPSPSRSRRGAS